MIARRNSLRGLGIALASIGIVRGAAASPAAPLVPKGAATLDALTTKLAAIPRRRDFKRVPMILDKRELWDADALDAVLHYTGGPKQSWDNTELKGLWLSVMRNSVNSQVFAFGHPDFLCISATRGSAQMALYDQAMWDKYELGKLVGVPANHFVKAGPASAMDPADYQNHKGAFSSAANSIEGLQRRGVVFLACHNAIWELAGRLAMAGPNPDKLDIEQICAELSNHLVPGVVLTPGAVGTLVELAGAGFSFAA